MSEETGEKRVGEIVGGKYRLVRFVASGGMGLVFEAQHEVVRRAFAVKLLRPELASRRDALGRFQREAAAAGALTCEHVAATVDFGFADDGTPFIVMELLQGVSLATLLAQQGPLEVGRATELVRQACLGVQAAHDAGILHRDLKPANLFVGRRADETDWLKVLDFGVAKLREEGGDERTTRTGVAPGTPVYMSPEQARGERELDGRTDVYALGAILYESLTGQWPHPGEGREAVLHHVATQAALPLSRYRADVPEALHELLARCLAPSREARPASAAALAEELAPFAKRSVSRAEGPSASARPAPGVVSPPVARAATTVDAGERRPRAVDPRVEEARAGRLRGWRRGAVGLALLALGVGGWGAWRVMRSSAPTATGERRWDPSARFFVPAAPPGAVQQIAALEKAQDNRRLSLLTSLYAVPRAVWLTDGTPAEVELRARTLMARASRENAVPTFVTYNLPYRDCAQYSSGGALDVASFLAWIEGFARGLGTGPAVVMLEPDSLGIIPYNRALDGSAEWCRPTVVGQDGKNVPAPEADPEVRFAAVAEAVARIEKLAPRAAVYLDGTHSRWLSVGDAAYRLARGGIRRAQGFYVNLGNIQSTSHSLQYGTFIARCLARAFHDEDRPTSFATCATPRQHGDLDDEETWSRTAAWYAQLPPVPESELTHFVIDTSRNGRRPLSAKRFLAPPFSQPPSVVKALDDATWCNARGLGAGPRPTARPGLPLVDALLWAKPPGESDGSCDVAGGARVWDFSRYNPWGLGEEAQRHFDPLWAMVDPAAGDWFPDLAIELAENAVPAWETPRERRNESPAISLPPPPTP